MRGADVFIGVSAPGTLTTEMVKTMAKDAIIFACANPTPEIFPEDAKAGGATVATDATEKKTTAAKKTVAKAKVTTAKTVTAPKKTTAKVVTTKKNTEKATDKKSVAKKVATAKKTVAVKETTKKTEKSTKTAKNDAKSLAAHQRIIQHSLEMANLKPNQCRWPIGDPDSEHFHFCGETVFVGKPYCYEHCKQAYQFAPPKKK